MHSEILNDNQELLLPLMTQFRREYYLVGGTAVDYLIPDPPTDSEVKQVLTSLSIEGI